MRNWSSLSGGHGGGSFKMSYHIANAANTESKNNTLM